VRLAAVRVLCALVISLCASTAWPAFGDETAGPPTTLDNTGTLCTIFDVRVPEISGAVTVEDSIWVINDKGREVFRVDSSCQVTRATRFTDEKLVDVEDMAFGSDGTLWLIDSGGNRSPRDSIALIGKTQDDRIRRTSFTYPDGDHDAEAGVVTPDGHLVLITKVEGGDSSVYTAPVPGKGGGDPVELREVGELAISEEFRSANGIGSAAITAATLSPDGLHIALRSYSAVFEWEIVDGEIARTLVETEPTAALAVSQTQGEGIAYEPDGDALVLLSEQLPSPVLRVEIDRNVTVQEPVRGSPPTWAWVLVRVAAVVAAANVVVAIARRRTPRSVAGPRYLRVVGKPWITLSALTFMLVGGASLLAVQQQENAYESTALIGFQPRDPSVTSADTLALVTPKFLALLDSSTTLRRLGDELGVDEARLRSSIDAVIEPGTATLRISVTRTDPEAAAKAANALAAAVLQDAGRDDLVLAQRVSAGVRSESPTPPTPSQFMAVGLITALVAALAVALVVRRVTDPHRSSVVPDESDPEAVPERSI